MSSPNKHGEIHGLAQFFAVKSECDGIVLLTDKIEPAIISYPSSAMILLLQIEKDRYKDLKDLPDNVSLLPLEAAKPEFLAKKIFVCVDYLENDRPDYASISSIAEDCALAVFSAAKSGDWDIQKLRQILRLNPTTLYGQFSKKELLAIGGRLTNVNSHSYPNVSVLAVISQYNEVDIIEPVIEHLLAQGVDVYVIDNWSNDGGYEAVEGLAKKYPGRVEVERFPKRQNNKYEWRKILNRVTEVAKEKKQYQWIISNDADEIRWSPWPSISLQRAISFIDALGFNIIDHTVFNFSPVEDGFRHGVNPLAFFKYGDFGHEGWHFMQLKTWKNNHHADLASSSGHLVKIPKPKIFPLKFLIGHYPLRSNWQARKKIFQDRKPRFLKQERKKGWHSHYDRAELDQNFIKDRNSLIGFSANGNMLEDYLVERLSGIGIKVN